MRTPLIPILLAAACGAPPSVSGPPPSPTPPPLELPADLPPPDGVLMLGELHGTREIPAQVGAITAAAAARGPVVLALEIPHGEQAALDAYLGSAGDAAARARLVARAWWQGKYQDGRRSVAMADLLETVRALRASGRTIHLVAMDEEHSASADAREAAMAERVLAARRAHPGAAMIAHAGNLHARKAEIGFRRGFAWMAMRVAAAGVPVISLDARYPDGTAWVCTGATGEDCGVSFMAGHDAAPIGVHREADPSGAFDGWFGTATATASPPAGIPAAAAQLEAQIAAAPSSPSAIRTKARRAYAAKQYGACADLFASIAKPDASTAYDHACCLALAGRTDEAFAQLERAIAAGFTDFAHLEADDDLISLRGDPRWPPRR